MTTDNTEQFSSDDKKEPKRKVTRKKKDEVNESNNEIVSSDLIPDMPTEAINNVSNQQEAPFPSIPMNPSEEEHTCPPEFVPTIAEEQPIGADFHMFDDGEEAF